MCLRNVGIRTRNHAVSPVSKPHSGNGLDDKGVGVRVPVGAIIFIFPCPDRMWGPPSLLSGGCRGSFLGVKRPGREADHSSPTSAEVKKTGVFASTPPHVFMA
jgi:hypothetical protein